MNRLEKMIAIACVGVAACTSSSTGGGSGVRDAGTPPRSDSGVMAARDGGASAVDAGHPGTPPAAVDAGSVAPGPADAGPPPASSGACTNAADQAVIASTDVPAAVSDCARMSFGAEPATMDCIVTSTGLTMACSSCYDAAIACSISSCLTDCFGGDSPGCMACRATHCDPAFGACSGLAS